MRFPAQDNDTGKGWKQKQCLGNWESQLSKQPVLTGSEITYSKGPCYRFETLAFVYEMR